MIHHIPLSLRIRYVYCCAPVNRKQPFVCAMFTKVIFEFFFPFPVESEWKNIQRMIFFKQKKNMKIKYTIKFFYPI